MEGSGSQSKLCQLQKLHFVTSSHECLCDCTHQRTKLIDLGYQFLRITIVNNPIQLFLVNILIHCLALDSLPQTQYKSLPSFFPQGLSWTMHYQNCMDLFLRSWVAGLSCETHLANLSFLLWVSHAKVETPNAWNLGSQ